MKHTPTPWKIDKREVLYAINTDTKHIGVIASDTIDGKVRGEGCANAQHIVHCVNTHDALVEALEAWKKANDGEALLANSMERANLGNKALKLTEAALEAAKEKE